MSLPQIWFEPNLAQHGVMYRHSALRGTLDQVLQDPCNHE
jgi:hypothetical protein